MTKEQIQSLIDVQKDRRHRGELDVTLTIDGYCMILDLALQSLSQESVRSEGWNEAIDAAARIAAPKSDNPVTEWERGYWAAENVIAKDIRALQSPARVAEGDPSRRKE